MCHICLTNSADSIIKCKLCCDGLERDSCTECAKLYAEYKKNLSHEVFQELQQRRQTGINWHNKCIYNSL